jgi:hypothetical protein
MPIRLCVDKDQAAQAAYILVGDLEGMAELEKMADDQPPEDETTTSEPGVGNPWELLVIAFYFLIPAIGFLHIDYPGAFGTTAWARYAISAVAVAHLLGWLSIAFASALVAAYFWVWSFEPRLK